MEYVKIIFISDGDRNKLKVNRDIEPDDLLFVINSLINELAEKIEIPPHVLALAIIADMLEV